MNGALYVSSSGNAKIGDADATYLSIKATCPSSCGLRDRGCYAQVGNVAMHVRRIEAEVAPQVDVNQAEVDAIDAATPHPQRPLRLHVSGDRRQGYAPALVVAAHPLDGRAYQSNGVRWIPCPAQTRDNVTCVSCRLCFDADALFARRAGIAFEAHGARRKIIAKRIVSLLLFQERTP